MKRFLFLFFATLFALTTWAYNFVKGSIYYNIIDGGVEVTYMSSGSSSSYSGEVTVPSTVTNGDVEYTVISIGNDAFEYSKTTKLTLPNTIQHIGSSFYYSEVQEVVFLDGVTSLTLDANAFEHAENLTSINLPSVLTAIPNQGFDNCTSLATIEIPAAVTSIGANAFRRCPLTSVTCLATTPPTCQSTTFNNVTTSGVTLYVPSGSVDAYKGDSVWGGFNVQAIDDGGGSGGGGGSYTIVFSPANGGTETLPESGFKEFTVSCEDGIAWGGGSYTWSLRDDGGNGVSVSKTTPSEDGKSLTITLASTITTAGTYSLAYSNRGKWNTTIPAGTFLLGPDGEVESEEMSYSFTLVEEGSGTGGSGDHVYSIEPDPDVEQSSLQNFTFTSYDGICGNDEWYAEYNGTVSIYKDGSTEPYATTTDISGDWDSSVSFDYDVYLYINFENEITEAGEYELVIPAGLFNWYDDDNPTLNEEIRFSYTVTGSTGPVTGEHGGDYLTVETMGFDLSSTSDQTITYTGPSGTVYEVKARYSDSYVGDINFFATTGYLKNTESVGYLRQVIFEPNGAETSSSTFTIRASHEAFTGTLSSDFSNYGEVVAEIPINEGGTVELSDDYEYFACYGGSAYTNYRFKSIEVVWETGGGYTGDHVYTIEPDPEVEQSSLQVFTIYAPNGVCANDEYYSSEYDGTVYLYKDGDSEPYASTSDIEGDVDFSVTWNGDYKLVFTFESEITETGEYEFVIPAGIFIWMSEDGDDLGVNDEMRFSYTVTGGTSTGGDYTIVVSPESGETLESLSEFTITCEDGIGQNNTEDPLEVVKGEVVVAHAWGDTPIYASDGISVIGYTFVICDPSTEADLTLTDEGEYTIHVPGEYFFLGDNDDVDEYNEEFDIVYIIKTNAGTETGIGGISINDENVEGIYSTSGQKLNKAQKGVNIIRYTDGSVKKLYVK